MHFIEQPHPEKISAVIPKDLVRNKRNFALANRYSMHPWRIMLSGLSP